MGINPNQINIIDNTGSSAVEGSVIVSKNTGEHLWSSNSSSALKLPSGSTAQRLGAARNGHLRFNTDLATLEMYSEVAPIGWKSVGQLNIDGTFNSPGIAFSSEPNSGLYRPANNQIALSISGAQKVLWTATNQTISTNLTVVGTITANAIVFSGPTAALSPKPTETLNMNDGATNAALGGSFIYAASSKAGMIVDYVLKRGTNFKVGTMIIANSTTAAQVTDTMSASSANIGVTFGVNVSAGNVVVNYTSTTTGQTITGKFSIREWGAF